MADGLDRVGMHRDAEFGPDRGELGDRLDRADLVVGPHQRDESGLGGVLLELRAQVGGRDDAVGVDREQDELGAGLLGQPLRGVEDGVMFDRRGDDPATAGVGVPLCPVDPLDRQVVGLGAAAGEDDLGGPGTDRRGDGLAGLLEPTTCGATGSVQRRGVTRLREDGRHRLDGFGQHLRRSGVVEVDRRLHGRSAWHGHR